MTKVRPHIEVLKALDDCQVALAITGDQRAFELLYKRWHPKLLRLAMRMTQNKDDDQDVMQDAAITIAKNIGHLKDPSKVLSMGLYNCKAESRGSYCASGKSPRDKSSSCTI